MKISEIFGLYTEKSVDDFLLKLTGLSLNESNIKEQKLLNHFRYVGDINTNASTIDLLSDSGKGLIERITNSIDAVIEKAKIKNNSRPNLESIIDDNFPRFSTYRKNVINSNGSSNLILKAMDADDQVKVMISDGSNGSLPSVDIRDNGTGIHADDFSKTILSLHGNNKISVDKNYLIGSFGQGGSTSLSFAAATLILSKFNNSIFFTIVKRVQINNMKSHAYCYLVSKKKIPYEIEIIDKVDNDHYKAFIESESGTVVRMIDVQLEKRLRGSDITKPLGLIDYINTELFNVQLPIKLIDNRDRFKKSAGYQNRNAMGSMMKLKTTSFVKKEYSGTYQIPFQNCYLDVDYYVILPADENDWGKDKVCEEKYSEFNAHDKPIFYTVNGQYIMGEGYTRLSNGGLNFLKHRLIVNINLDKLGRNKYKFFTTDRSKIKKIDDSSRLYDEVIDYLVKDKKLIEINDIIAQKAISTEVDSDIINQIRDNVLNDYRDFLTGEGFKRKRISSEKKQTEERILYHYIDNLNIPTNKQIYYRNDEVNIKLVTNAYKNVNMDAQIDCFVNDKFFTEMIPNFKNGEIVYDFTKLPIGNYSVYFQIIRDEIIESNTYDFMITSDLKKLVDKKIINTGDLDLSIETVTDKETIVEVVKEHDGKYIRIYICYNHPDLDFVFFDLTESSSIEIKQKLLKPLTLLSLFYKKYDDLDTDSKNALMISYIRSIINLL